MALRWSYMQVNSRRYTHMRITYHIASHFISLDYSSWHYIILRIRSLLGPERTIRLLALFNTVLSWFSCSSYCVSWTRLVSLSAIIIIIIIEVTTVTIIKVYYYSKFKTRVHKTKDYIKCKSIELFKYIL